jgi:hypothetical protein
MLSTSIARAIRPQPAPSAARIASSCWRASARTSNRLATFAQAITSTSASVPITTQSAVPTSPTISCFRGWTWGARRAFWNCVKSMPGGVGQAFNQIPNMRATSALACSMVTPGLSRAIPWPAKGPRDSMFRSNRRGRISSGSRWKRNASGITPITVWGLESIVSVRPTMDGSPAKRRCQ